MATAWLTSLDNCKAITEGIKLTIGSKWVRS